MGWLAIAGGLARRMDRVMQCEMVEVPQQLWVAGQWFVEILTFLVCRR